MKRTILILIGMLLSTQSVKAEINEFGFDPASFVKPDRMILNATPMVTKNVQTGYTKYEYVIASQSLSSQKMVSFDMEVGDSLVEDGGTVDFDQIVSNKLGWTSGGITTPHSRKQLPLNFQGSIEWSVDRIELAGRLADDDEQFRPPQNALNPGEKLTVSFNSRGIPGIHRFWARGWVRPTTEEEVVAYAAYQLGDPGITNADMIPGAFWATLPSDAGYRDAFQGKTISPRLPPTKSEVLRDTFVLDLIAQVREAVTLGWIRHDSRKDDDNRGKDKGDEKGVKKGQDKDEDAVDDGDDSELSDPDKKLPGVARSIIKKLTKVRRECMRGRLGESRERLRALIRQVNALRGKHLTDESYFLIRFNAEFLLEQF